MSRHPFQPGRDPVFDKQSRRTPGTLGRNDFAQLGFLMCPPNQCSLYCGDSPGPLGFKDGAAPQPAALGPSVVLATSPFSLFPEKVTSPFGWRKATKSFHRGIDFGVSLKTPLASLITGKARLKYHGDAGWYVELSQNQQVVWRYLHLDKKTKELFSFGTNALISTEREVGKGELIAYSGNTGKAGTVHLHLDKGYGSQVNPLVDFTYEGRAPENLGAFKGSTGRAISASEVFLSLSVSAEDWDLASVTIRLVKLNGQPYPQVPLKPYTCRLTVGGVAPDRLWHEGAHIWSIERTLKGLPTSSDSKTAWTFEVTATTIKDKSSAAQQFTYTWGKG